MSKRPIHAERAEGRKQIAPQEPPQRSFGDTFLRVLKSITDGGTTNAIAAEHGVSPQHVDYVRNRAAEAGFLNPRDKRRREGQRAKIIELSKTLSVPAIAIHLELSQGYVFHVLKAAGIKPKRYEPPVINHVHHESRVAAKCVAELLAGVPPRKIQKRYNVADYYLVGLKKILREAGLAVPLPGRHLSTDAIKYIGMAMQFLSLREASIAFGLNEKTVLRIKQQSSGRDQT